MPKIFMHNLFETPVQPKQPVDAPYFAPWKLI